MACDLDVWGEGNAIRRCRCSTTVGSVEAQERGGAGCAWGANVDYSSLFPTFEFRHRATWLEHRVMAKEYGTGTGPGPVPGPVPVGWDHGVGRVEHVSRVGVSGCCPLRERDREPNVLYYHRAVENYSCSKCGERESSPRRPLRPLGVELGM